MILDKLLRIQTQIKAPKNMYNSFGKYKYRNAESILEAVKPYLAQEGCVLTLSDEIDLIGDYVYVRATAKIIDCTDGQSVAVFASARESQDKKGMDDSQMTGTASSYARKYALNGLLLLDDTKDADTDEYTQERKARRSPGEKSPKAGNVETIACAQCGADIRDVVKKDGETWAASDVAMYSQKRFGRPLCASCQRKALTDEKKGQVTIGDAI